MTRDLDSLSPAFDADCRYLDTTAGRVAYYADTTGSARPLVLVHSLNACASAKEMEPLFDAERGSRPVFAIDLPGFGRSERGDCRYTPELMADALLAVLRDAAPRGADVVALSLGSEIAARAATLCPELVHSLALISPTGFSKRKRPQRLPRTERAKTRGEKLLRVVGSPLFTLLSSRPLVQLYLHRSFAGKPDAALVDYAVETANAPGARFAPLAFLGGKLFTENPRDTLYDRVTCPVLVLFDEDPYVDFDRLPAFLTGKPRWTSQRIRGTRGMPHYDRPAATLSTLEAFFDDRLIEADLPESVPARRISDAPRGEPAAS